MGERSNRFYQTPIQISGDMVESNPSFSAKYPVPTSVWDQLAYVAKFDIQNIREIGMSIRTG